MKERLFLLVSLVGLVAACGHPATRQDCERIIDKTAELKLREDHVNDPEVIEQKIAGYKEARGEEAMKKCMGKTITESAILCVERAQTSDAVDACLY